VVAKAGTVLPKAEQVAMLHALDELTSRVEAASMLASRSAATATFTARWATRRPVYSDYVAAYKRNGIARAVVKRPVGACWREAPEVVDDDRRRTTRSSSGGGKASSRTARWALTSRIYHQKVLMKWPRNSCRY